MHQNQGTEQKRIESSVSHRRPLERFSLSENPRHRCQPNEKLKHRIQGQPQAIILTINVSFGAKLTATIPGLREAPAQGFVKQQLQAERKTEQNGERVAHHKVASDTAPIMPVRKQLYL